MAQDQADSNALIFRTIQLIKGNCMGWRKSFPLILAIKKKGNCKQEKKTIVINRLQSKYWIKFAYLKK